jgi:hypothetical protein
MKYYTTTTEFNRGIERNERQMYVCVMDRQRKKLVHSNVRNNDFDYFLKLVHLLPMHVRLDWQAPALVPPAPVPPPVCPGCGQVMRWIGTWPRSSPVKTAALQRKDEAQVRRAPRAGFCPEAESKRSSRLAAFSPFHPLVVCRHSFHGTGLTQLLPVSM